jgi:hypothetical protein
MKKLLILVAILALHGCVLVPNSIRPEVEHMSHATQHEPFTSHPTNYGVNMVDLVAHWDIKKIAYVEIGEGIALGKPTGCAQYADAGYGEVIGPREQFIARIGLIIPTK